MNEVKTYDYLVLGGVHDRMITNAPRCAVIEIPADDSKRLAKFCDPSISSSANEIEVIGYRVIEHICEDGRHFFIASNDDLTDVDVFQAIRESGISPIN
ncbi:hypothetical protein IMY97_22680 [Pectobacterium versatile]|uniref:hypothetical protein n=1 Tax=Pectobacterium versatile TaxID=2488639 RepID=UPI001660384E|nr:MULTISPECIES: hypothetical protein [Pectobacterium]MBD0845698.1 hypothetical protein [Pectobacterium carotovorum subsp. carotovorum]MBK4826952.1 hypothetical protein [Pectobacterium carotovorum subsp. carotovorum]UNE80064.1 hypothetical protein IMY97_22680 [Pectobacterium versatile]